MLSVPCLTKAYIWLMSYNERKIAKMQGINFRTVHILRIIAQWCYN